MVTIHTTVQIKEHVRANFRDFSSPEKYCINKVLYGVKLNIGYSFGKKLLEVSNYKGIIT